MAGGLGGGFGAPAGARTQGAGPAFGVFRPFGADPRDGEEAGLDTGQQEDLGEGQRAGGPGAAGGFAAPAFDDSDAWDDTSSFRGAGAGGGGGGLGRRAGGGGFGQRARVGHELPSHDQVRWQAGTRTCPYRVCGLELQLRLPHLKHCPLAHRAAATCFAGRGAGRWRRAGR